LPEDFEVAHVGKPKVQDDDGGAFGLGESVTAAMQTRVFEPHGASASPR
jgi:hypothetical protein